MQNKIFASVKNTTLKYIHFTKFLLNFLEGVFIQWLIKSWDILLTFSNYLFPESACKQFCFAMQLKYPFMN